MALETHRTVCNRDCPDACGLIATVEDGRLVRLQGERDHPVTQGFLCHRTSRFPERQNSPERITTPLLRRGGRLEPATWDEVVPVLADRLLAIRGESGPAAILHYRSGGSLGMLKALVERFFELFGPVSVKRGDICSGAGDAAQLEDFGEEDAHDLFDVENSRSILLWGKNATVSNVHLVPLLQKAARRGARVLLIDPVPNRTSRLAGRTILVRPGGDFDLAMGAAAVLFASGGVDPEAASYCDHLAALRALALSRSVAGWAAAADVSEEDVRAVAGALADRPCSIQVGWGMGRRLNGAAIVRALDALSAISGNLGIPGGGVSFYFKRRGAFDLSFLEKSGARRLLEPRLGHEILDARDPAVRAVWVTCANPVAMLPDSASVARALETRELVVVADSFLTDTARRATVVLPTRTLVEEDDLLGAYGHHYVSASTPALAPPPAVLSDLEIVQRLAAAIDARAGSAIAPQLAGPPRAWKERILAKLAPHGIDLATLERSAVRNPLSPKVMFADRRFATASGRVNLVHEAPPPPPAPDGYPLWLFSNSTERSQCSQWVAGEEPEVLTARCHPDAAPGLADGEAIVLESATGVIRARLVLDPSQRRDVVLVPKGGSFDRGTCANALVPARATDAGEGAAYLDCRVRIRRAAPGEEIRDARAGDAAEVATARALFEEYARSLDFSLCFQGFDREIASLPGAYAPPRGALLLAFVDGLPAGCGALREHDAETGEVKRIYVRACARGTGLGRRITEALLARARAAGYRRVVLDTVAGRMDVAIALYRKLGFVEIAPYRETPVPGALYLEKRLT